MRVRGIRMRGISKEFSGKWALTDMDIEIKSGTIHAIIGENGAGKSTLMNILSGALTPTSGAIEIDGVPMAIKNPQEASAAGIGMVYQHFMLIPTLKVWQNAILGIEPVKKNGSIDKQAAIALLTRVCADYNIQLNFEQMVGNLTVGEQQRVEILKVMIRSAEFLIFDEPTSVLTPLEIEQLLENFRTFKLMGKTIVFISHKLEEVMSIADEITVIRHGRKIGTMARKKTDADALVTMMVGREVKSQLRPAVARQGDALLRVSGLCTMRSQFSGGLCDVSFALREGEVLGFAGVDGNGQSELVDAIFGLGQVTSGSIKKRGQELVGMPSAKIRRLGIALIPPDRHRQGLVLDSSISRNLLLGCEDNKQLGNGFAFSNQAIAKQCGALAKKYDVRMPSLEALASELSGGNQQKVILAREFGLREFDLIVAMNPTRGLDVGAIEFVYELIEQQKLLGKAVLLISTELSEILRLSDRIAVLFKGRIIDILDRESADSEKLGMLMAGISLKEGAIRDAR